MKKRLFSGAQVIAAGFLVIILLGTLLLMLPISAKSGEGTDFLTSLFTATSATCVTGLVRVDTFSHWSAFGQIVLLLLIQVGGLGFITFGVLLSITVRHRISLRTRSLVKDSISAMEYHGIIRLVISVLKGTLLFEGAGAVLLAARFIPEMGFGKGLWYGMFHSISAFCNAGFDLMGFREPGSSLTVYRGDVLVNVVMIALILIGGLGFIVWQDIAAKKLRVRKYSLQTKIVLCGMAVLVAGGSVIYWLLERKASLAGLPAGEQILGSLFAVVTPRTAGFNTLNVPGMSDAGKLFTGILMFIGGNPGSTAGGAKVTSVAVLLLSCRSMLKRDTGVQAFGRSIAPETVHRAAMVCLINLTLMLTATILISAAEGTGGIDTGFEVMSAVSTVGMSVGITALAGPFSQVVLIAMMYLGRVGSLSFALSFTDKKRIAPVRLPEEGVNVG